MTVKTIVRYVPPNPIIGARELAPEDFKDQGVFTQKKKLVWAKEKGFWLDADEAKISPEALAWLEEQKGEFTVERQEIEDEETTPDEESAIAVAVEEPKTTTEQEQPIEGEQPPGAGTPGTTTGTTTSSTGSRSKR